MMNPLSHLLMVLLCYIIIIFCGFLLIIKKCIERHWERSLRISRDLERQPLRSPARSIQQPIQISPTSSGSEASVILDVNLVNECAICLAQFDKNDHIKVLKDCGHYYHKSCIMDWFKTSKTKICPKCGPRN